MLLPMPRPTLLGQLIVAVAFLVGCSPGGGSTSGTNRVTCPTGVAAQAAPAGAASGGEPDFALYGFPRVAASEQFTPGRELQIRTGPILLTIPPDFYTDPVRFDLLVGDEAVWQRCVPENRTVVAPYAIRITDPSGNRVGRFDKPVAATITDSRISSDAKFWTTSPANPPGAEHASAQPSIEGNTIRAANGSARIGWFTTAPKH